MELPVLTSAALPVLDAPPAERCDAARNRRRILEAAASLVAAEGADAVSLDRIAAQAGVGKGTVFRRFGDKANLLRSLLSEREAAFQDDFIRGPAPLGPGAPAAERLRAFGPALLATLEAHGELIRAAEASGGAGLRFHHGPYPTYRAHLRHLVRGAAPDADAEYWADVLLAAIAADLVVHQLRDRQMGLQRLADGWLALVDRLVACPGDLRS